MVAIYKRAIKTVIVVMVLNLCISSDDALYLYQIKKKYPKGFQIYCEDAVCILKFSKGHNSVNSVGGVMVLALFTLLIVFYICTKFCQILHRASELLT